MTFAKHPGQPPALDAGGMVKGMNAAAQNFPKWKRWVGGETEFDGTGLRDVVEANAQGLDAVKGQTDKNVAAIGSLQDRVAALEAAPQLPFPASGSTGASATASSRATSHLGRLLKRLGRSTITG